MELKGWIKRNVPISEDNIDPWPDNAADLPILPTQLGHDNLNQR